MDFIDEFDNIISLWSDGNPIEAISNASEDKVFEFAETMALNSRYHFKPENKPNRKIKGIRPL